MMHSVSRQSFQRNHYVSTRLIEIITRTITTGNNNNNNNNKPLLVNIGARVFLSSAAAHNNNKNNNNNAPTIRNILTPSPRHSTSTSSSSSSAAVSFHTTCLQRHNDEQVATRKAVDTPESSSSSSSSSNNNNKTKEIPPIKWTTHRLKPEQIEKVDAIFHKILWLDLVETSMLTDSINYKLGVKLTPKQRAALERQLEGSGVGGLLFGSSSSSSGVGDEDTDAAAAAAEAKDTGPKNVDLKLTGFDAKSKIKVIKEVRAAIAGLGLKEAKELVEGAPTVIQKDLKPEVAEELKAKLEAVGATVELIILA